MTNSSFQPVGKFFTEFSPEDVQCSVKVQVQVVVFKIIIIKLPRAALVSYDMRSLVMLLKVSHFTRLWLVQL